MVAKLSTEQSAALLSCDPGQPLRVEDDQGNVYFLVSAADLPRLWADFVDAEEAKGLADIEAGDIVSWDPDKIKQLAR